MGTISRPNTYTANTVISPSQVNDDFDTIYNEFNGSIAAANLATAAVTTAKIANDAVTVDKLADSSVTYAQLTSTLLSGWTDANETWTYASGTGTNVGTFTITGDKTGKYQAGDKVQFTQTTVKYGIITKVAYSNPSTTVTIYMGTDYTIANAAISANYYSKVKSPQGFPIDPAKWTITTTNTSLVTQNPATVGVVYNPGTLQISLPIGSWLLSLQGPLSQDGSVASGQFTTAGLSTANNSFSDNDLIAGMYIRTSTTSINYNSINVRKHITTTSTTVYYAVISVQTGGGTISTGFGGGSTVGNTVIRAVCAYL